MRTLMRKVCRDLWARKGAIASLIAIVMTGVGSFTSMTSVFRDLDSARAEYYDDQRLADFTIDLKRAPQWIVKDLMTSPNVKELRGRISLPVRSELTDVDLPISGVAISMPSEPQDVINGVVLRSGHWFSNDKEMMVDEKFAEAHNLKPGDRIKVLLLDREHDLLITGMVLSPEFVYKLPPQGGLAPDPARFAVYYMGENFLGEAADLKDAYNQIIGIAYNNQPDTLNETLNYLETQLDAYGVTNKIPLHEQISVKFLRDELAGLKVSATVMPLIFLGISALILNVMMKRLTTQQRSIVGTLKAFGYSNSTITRHYLSYGLFVGGVGCLFGVALGWWMQYGMLSMYKHFYALPVITQHFYWDLQMFGCMISLVSAAIGTVNGVRYAGGLMPAEAMSPPPPEKGGKVLPEYIGLFWDNLTFRQKMVFRSIFRNPFRSFVSVFSAAIATAIIFSAFSIVSSLDYLMHFEFEKIAHEDLTLSLRDPVDIFAKSEIRHLNGISGIEPQLSIICDLSNGIREKRIGVLGLVENNYLYTPLDSEQQSVTIPNNGLVLSRKLAEILNVHPAETLLLRPLIGERRQVEAMVTAIVDTFLGLSAYANIGYLSRLIGEEKVTSSFLATSYTHDLQTDLLEQIKDRPEIVGISERLRSLIQLEDTFGESMGAIISIMVLLAGIIAFGSVLNTTLVSISERQREIGTLRVIGYSLPNVSVIFCGESLLLNGFGISIGLYMGIGLAHLISNAYNTEFYRFPAIILTNDLILSAVIMLILVLLSQGIIYRLISKLNWLDVLSIKE